MRLIWTHEVANPKLPLLPAWALFLSGCSCGAVRGGGGGWFGWHDLGIREDQVAGRRWLRPGAHPGWHAKGERGGNRGAFPVKRGELISVVLMSTYVCLLCIIHAWKWVVLSCSLHACVSVTGLCCLQSGSQVTVPAVGVSDFQSESLILCSQNLLQPFSVWLIWDSVHGALCWISHGQNRHNFGFKTKYLLYKMCNTYSDKVFAALNTYYRLTWSFYL